MAAAVRVMRKVLRDLRENAGCYLLCCIPLGILLTIVGELTDIQAIQIAGMIPLFVWCFVLVLGFIGYAAAGVDDMLPDFKGKSALLIAVAAAVVAMLIVIGISGDSGCHIPSTRFYDCR